MTLFSTLTIIFLCIIFSAIFSAAETAMTSASLGKIKSMQKDKGHAVEKVINLKSNSDSFLSTILIANNIANILASSVAATYLSKNFGEEAVFYSTAAMTFLLIVFAELLPKTLALRNAELFSLKMAKFIHFVIFILAPLSLVLRYIVNSISKLLGSKKKKLHISVLEELRGTLRFHSDLGNVNKHDFHMLDGLLDLEKLPLKGVMIHRKYIYSIDIKEPIDKIISKAFSSGYSKIPLWQDKQDNIVAVLDVKLLLKILSTNIEYSKIDISEITIKPWFVPETTSLKNQLAAFREECSYFAIVVDEYGEFKGVITLRDIIEEIVGILQEEEENESTIVQNSDGSFTVSADYSVRDFVRLTDFNISNNISNTIGGIVVNIARHIPEEGEEVVFKKHKFIVIEKNGKKLSKILIRPLEFF